MLKLTLIGNLGGDATVREVSGQSVITFNVAHTESYTDRSGTKVERTTWVRCDYWRPSDRVSVAQYLKKGTQVYVEGVPSTRAWESQTGEWRASMECRVMDLKLLGTKSQNPGAPMAPMPAAAAYSAPSGGSPIPPQPAHTPASTPVAAHANGFAPAAETGDDDDLPF